MAITIYHNPNCGTSRKVLGILREAGHMPHVIEYLKNPPSRAELVKLLRDMEMTPRALLRAKGDVYSELGLVDPKITDDELIGAMAQHPILIERPIVITEKGTRLCRPAEKVNEVL
jgi:arsenate reductase